MSEFADSVHFYGITSADAAKALERAGGGVVLAANDRVTSLLIAWEDKPAFLEAQPGLALDYSYAEDHGLWLRFYQDGVCRARLEVVWGGVEEAPEDEEPEVSPFLAEFLSNFFGANDALRLSFIAEQLLEPDWSARDQLIDELGVLLKLPAFRWVGCEHVQHGDSTGFLKLSACPEPEHRALQSLSRGGGDVRRGAQARR